MTTDAITKIEGSNSLADLAARIKLLHTKVAGALRDSVRHGIEAGDLLIEAKAQLKHGQWLPWLRDHCTILERTAQLYMRCAKNREAIEKNATVADLTLNEAAALLMLSSDVRKLLNFARDCEGLSGEELIERCIAEGVATFQSPDYQPFAGRTEAEIIEWHLFNAFLSFDAATGRSGGEPQKVWEHIEWLLQRPFQNVAEWLGKEGENFRRRCGIRPISDDYKAEWAAFLSERRGYTLADAHHELETLQQQCSQALKEGRLHINGRKPSRGRARRCAEI
jgi:hypothetical protein